MQVHHGLLLLATVLLAACDSGPDGPQRVRQEMVLFASNRGAGDNLNLWMTTPEPYHEDKPFRQLTFFEKGDYFPADLSPDGRRLLFYRFDDGTLVSGVFELRLDEVPLRGVEAGEDEALAWGLARQGSYFPAGDRFLYVHFTWVSAERGHDVLYLYDMRDSSRVQVTDEQIGSYFAAVSPDGRYICFDRTTAEPPTRAIYLLDLVADSLQVVTPVEQFVTSTACHFSRDGRRLYFTMNVRRSFSSLHELDLETGALREVIEEELPEALRYENQWWPHPDAANERIFFRTGGGYSADPTSEIMVVDAAGRNVEALTEDGYRDDKPVVGVVEFLE